MSWKFVMRTENIKTLNQAVNIARDIWYEFILWNGNVWFVWREGLRETNLKIKDLY